MVEKCFSSGMVGRKFKWLCSPQVKVMHVHIHYKELGVGTMYVLHITCGARNMFTILLWANCGMYKM